MDQLLEKIQPEHLELQQLFCAQPPPLQRWVAMQREHLELAGGETSSLQQSFAAGLRAPAMGYAFFAGYQSAISRLLGVHYCADALYALCVTESSGNSPAVIETQLLPGAGAAGVGEDAQRRLLHGTKTFVTGGELVDRLLVLAVDEYLPEGRKAFSLVDLPLATVSREKMKISTLPALPVVPEIPHCAIRFDHLPVHSGQVLPGEGYDKYVRRFRWLEDTHVLAALSGFLHSVGRYWQSRDLVALSLGLFNGISSLGGVPDSSLGEVSGAGGSAVVVYGWLTRQLALALPGILAGVATEHEEQAQRITRDIAVLKVARSARERREEKVWSAWQITPT